MKNFVPHAITLTVYNEAGTKYGITWQTESEGSPILEYTDPDDLAFSNARRVCGNCGEGVGTVRNYAVITDLAPGEPCRWRVGDESGVFSNPAVFTALSHDPENLDFLVMTDTQDGENLGEWWKWAWQDAMKNFSHSELCIHCGDIVDAGGVPKLWQEMLDRNSVFLRRMPMLPVTGNHDYWECYLYGYSHVQERHFFRELPPQDTRLGMYYSTDCGPVHFTVLSSGDADETRGLSAEQLEWCKEDLEKTDKRWKVVSIHNPLYSPGKYGCIDPKNRIALALRAQLSELFARCGVDLVLCGHDHVYAKTYPIGADGQPDHDYTYVTETVAGIEAKIAVDPVGPIHLESGCAGNQNRGLDVEQGSEDAQCFEEMAAMRWGHVAYSAVQVRGDILTVTFRMISIDTGACVYRHAFGIRKDHGERNDRAMGSFEKSPLESQKAKA